MFDELLTMITFGEKVEYNGEKYYKLKQIIHNTEEGFDYILAVKQREEYPKNVVLLKLPIEEKQEKECGFDIFTEKKD